MKLRNKILAIAVVAVAGVNVYLANDVQVQRNELSLLNLENIAEGGWWEDFVEWWNRPDYYCKPWTCYSQLGIPWEGSQLCRDPGNGEFAHPKGCSC